MRVRVKVEMVGDDGQVVSEQAMVATVPASLTESSSADELALAAALRAMDMVGMRQPQARTEEAPSDSGRLQVRRQLGERASRVPSVETRRPAPKFGGNDEESIMAEVFAFERGMSSGGGQPRRPTHAQPAAAPKAPAAPSAFDVMRRAAATAPAVAAPQVFTEDGDDEVLPWPAAGTPGAEELEAGIRLALGVRD